MQEFNKPSFVLIAFVLTLIFVITGFFAVLSEIFPDSFNPIIWENVERETSLVEVRMWK
ncbi:MAG: hypothetical protein ACE5EJ_00870 [Nitrosopumilaceae archaeon]